RKNFIDERPAVFALRQEHAPVTSGVRGTRRRRTFGESDLRVKGQCTPAHSCDHDRNVQLNGLLGETGSKNCLRRALLAITLQRNAREGARKKSEIIEGCPSPLSQSSEAADGVQPRLSLRLNLVNHSGSKDAADLQLGHAKGPPAKYAIRACQNSTICGQRPPS